jgi:hypothetical protein
MALELIPGSLKIPGGRFYEDHVYNELSNEETLAFDKGFPHKEPLAFAGIGLLIERLEPDAAEAIKTLNLRCLEDMRTINEEAASKLPGVDGRARDVIREVMKEHGRVWGNSNNKTLWPIFYKQPLLVLREVIRAEGQQCLGWRIEEPDKLAG